MDRDIINYSTYVHEIVGWILIAHSSKGVCAIYLNQHPQALLAELTRSFPHATIQRSNNQIQGQQYYVAVSQLLTAPVRKPNIPLDIRGTKFQTLVWQQIMAIPWAQTRSYKALSAAIACPTAARAVGHACARNNLALVIPCHRVVSQNKAHFHYRWGAALKARLLAIEQRVVN